MNKITKENITQEQKKTLANLNIIFTGRSKAIKFYEDYSSIIL